MPNVTQRRVGLEWIFGSTIESGNQVIVDPVSKQVLYAAGQIAVLYDPKHSIQTNYILPSDLTNNTAKSESKRSASSSPARSISSTGSKSRLKCLTCWNSVEQNIFLVAVAKVKPYIS